MANKKKKSEIKQAPIKARKVMANKKKKSKLTTAQMKRKFKQHKIRECQINLHRLSIGMYFRPLTFMKFHKKIKYQLKNMHILCYRLFSVPKGTLWKTRHSWLFCEFGSFAQFGHPQEEEIDSEEKIVAVQGNVTLGSKLATNIIFCVGEFIWSSIYACCVPRKKWHCATRYTKKRET